MKFDFKKTNTVAIFLIVFGILLYVGISIIFPSFSYFISKTDKFKVSVLLKNFDGKNFLSITPLYDYPYHKIVANVSLQPGVVLKQKDLKVFYGYEAEFYPVSSQKISTKEELEKYLFFENESEIPNGTLISNEEAVFFISRGRARPFLGPETFLRLGFDWDDVEEDKDEAISSFSSGEKLNFTSAHPDGSLLEFPDGRIFLVWENQLLEVPEDVLEKTWEDAYVVKIEMQEKEPAGNCAVKKSSSKKISCRVDGVSQYQATGHTYLIEVPDAFAERVTEAKIKLSMLGNFNISVAKESLKRIKDELSLRYGGDLLK